MTDVQDKSNGYDASAHVFLRARNQRIGPTNVLKWSRLLPPGASVLDVGCGFGEPITKVLVEQGFDVFVVDASARMIEAFHERFPQVPTECAAIDEASLFDRQFDAVIAWGVIFLLPAELQPLAISKMAKALKPGGRLLFTSSRKPHRWKDGMTDMTSESLGEDVYARLLAENGIVLEGFDCDEGSNDYFFASKLPG